jgi:hypothetical protein
MEKQKNFIKYQKAKSRVGNKFPPAKDLIIKLMALEE